MEEGFELLERLEGLVAKRPGAAPLPMFTSCCPVSGGWGALLLMVGAGGARSAGCCWGLSHAGAAWVLGHVQQALTQVVVLGLSPSL